MTNFNDRRDVTGRGTASDERLNKRLEKHFDKAIDKAIANGKASDIGKDGIEIEVSDDDDSLHEPGIYHDNGGLQKRVYTGNDRYVTGDEIDRPKGGGGGGGPGKAGNGKYRVQDTYRYKRSGEDLLKRLFERLELPNMRNLTTADSKKIQFKNAGVVSSGTDFRRLNLHSKKERLKRLMSAEMPHKRQILEWLTEERDILSAYSPDFKKKPQDEKWEPINLKIRTMQDEIVSLKTHFNDASPADQARILEIEDNIEDLNKRIGRVPRWVPSADLKFRNRVAKPVPTSKAVVFCPMDVSVSMTEDRKRNAKVFYFLLEHFLKKYYEHVELVYIRHTDTADEVSEEEFYHGTVSGSTLVSSALEKINEIRAARYPTSEWNIYIAQATDGDSFDKDPQNCAQMIAKMLPEIQGLFYTEIQNGQPSSLWRAYAPVQQRFKDRFWMGQIKSEKDIWPIFSKFFEKKDAEASAPRSAHAMQP